MDMDIKFTYHDVGQGLFYTGRAGDFNFVYDCGSKAKTLLGGPIRAYNSDELNGKSLDLLIISHFHEDHVIGLEELLRDLKVDTVILPYLTPIERLIVALKNSNLSKWYYEFLSDPVSFLFDKEVTRIVMVGGKEGEEEHPPERKDEIPSEGNIKIDWEKLLDDRKLKGQIEGDEPKWKKYVDEGELLIKKHEGYITIPNLWVFRFFNYKLEEKKLTEFNKCLKKKKLDLSTPDKIKQVIIDKDRRSTVRECYKVLNGDLNYTSLILYHGPIRNYKTIDVDCFCESCWGNFCGPSPPSLHPPNCEFAEYPFDRYCARYSFKKSGKLGQLLTGDINLDHGWDDIENHFKGYFQSVSMIQIPHHCSKRSWNKKILGELKGCPLWIASAGISNKYGHPNISVIREILDNGRCFCWSNEFNKVTIKGKIRW